MDRNEAYAKLTSIFHEVLGNDELVLTPELAADDVDEWDSLSHVRLILTIEKVFGVSFSAAEVGRLRNVGELVALILSKCA